MGLGEDRCGTLAGFGKSCVRFLTVCSTVVTICTEHSTCLMSVTGHIVYCALYNSQHKDRCIP